MSRAGPRPRGEAERGSAVLAAVFVAACVSLMAVQAARTSGSGARSAEASRVRDRLELAAEAGVAMALDHLTGDSVEPWTLDATPHQLQFDGAELLVTVEDERGKIPLNAVTPPQARAMFQLAGADAAQAETLTAAFMERRNARPPSKDSDQPDVTGLGPFRTVGELALLPGLAPAVFAVIAPEATVSAGDNAFESRTAGPLALAVMGGAVEGVGAIERARERAGQRAAFDRGPALDPTGRTLTVRVSAELPGARLRLAEVVDITGRPIAPVVVRGLELD